MIKFIWRQKLGRKECPYLIRWVADFYVFSIRLHHWIASDDHRYKHDHPWDFITLVLSGSYTDSSNEINEWLTAGCIKFRRSFHTHTVFVPAQGCWTLLLTGPVKRSWGFWVGTKFFKARRYFFKYGHHPCQK